MVLDIPDNMYRTMTGRTVQPNQSLGQLSESAMMALSQQGNPQFNQAAIMEQAMAQQQMTLMAQQKNLEVPKVNFYPSNNVDPRKSTSLQTSNSSKKILVEPCKIVGS